MKSTFFPRGIFLALAIVLAMPVYCEETGKGLALLTAIRAQKLDDTIGELNQVKKAQQRGDVLPLLVRLWENDKQKYPDLPWNFVNLDAVRVNIADVLVQAYRNRQVKIDAPAIHKYVVQVATESKDLQARGTSILVLGVIDDGKDVPLIKNAVLEESESLSTYAIASLGMMCNEKAGQALESLPSVIKRKQLAERAKDMHQQYINNVKSKGGWCSQRPFV
jgi:hypothetical protein